MNANPQKTNLKVVLLGAASTGKTTILESWITESKPGDTSPTIGSAFFAQNVDVDGEIQTINFWDTAGSERYESMAPMYVRDSHVALILFDVTNICSFQKIQTYVEMARQNSDAEIVIAGNKIDLEELRMIGKEEAEFYASTHNFKYFETSALDNTGVDDLFNYLCYSAVQKAKSNPSLNDETSNQTQTITPTVSESQIHNTGCCS